MSKSFGPKVVLNELSFDIRKGQICALIGESGCGKTTTLRLINGLERPTSGQVYLNKVQFDYDRAVNYRRKMGYCLQGYTLFPHMNILENMSIIAKKSGWSAEKIKRRAEEVMDLVNLSSKDYLYKRPGQLSGGQAQRVGIARAIFMNPDLLLMDEPFGALDPITRDELQDSFIQLQKKLGLTVVLVTHDLSEAFKMSHEIILLKEGTMLQKGRPNQLLMYPVNEYVKEFLRTNSPGYILKSMPIYTVMMLNVWTTYKTNAGSYELDNIESGERTALYSLEQVLDFHRKEKQAHIFFVNSERKFQSIGHKNGELIEKNCYLRSEDDLIQGLHLLLDEKFQSVPVLNNDGFVVGRFGREAIDVIA